ncbi:MAG: TadE/TadG family type IV pilus assembly protein [Pseudomonadota bacterium]
MTHATNSPLRRLSRVFRRDQRGVSALEFALIAPLMALFYVGSVELASTMLADRKVTSSSSTMGDLVARLPAANNCALDDVFDVAELILEPYPTNARLRISSIQPNAATPTTNEVAWSYANAAWTARTAGDLVTLPAGIMAANGSIIMAEIEYDYDPPFNRFFQTDPTLTDTFYMRPRAIDVIQFSTVTCP